MHSPKQEKCISEVVRIGSIIIFHLSKLWMSHLLPVMLYFWGVMPKGKLGIDYSWECNGLSRYSAFHFKFLWMDWNKWKMMKPRGVFVFHKRERERAQMWPRVTKHHFQNKHHSSWPTTVPPSWPMISRRWNPALMLTSPVTPNGCKRAECRLHLWRLNSQFAEFGIFHGDCFNVNNAIDMTKQRLGYYRLNRLIV